MIPCLSQTLTLPHPFDQDLNVYADVGCRAIEVWLTKLETHLQSYPLRDVARAIADCGLTPVAAGLQGGLTAADKDRRKLAFAHLQRRLGLCQELRVPTLVVAGDFDHTGDPSTWESSQAALLQAAELAAAYQVRLAVEFLGRAHWCASLSTAAEWIAACGHPNLGLCFDVFHYYIGPSKTEDLALLHPGNLFHVQLCDLAGVPREIATDAHRILPGDGDFQLQPIVDLLRRIGYGGAVAVEAMNPDFWRMKPVQVAEAAITSLRRVLGLACQ